VLYVRFGEHWPSLWWWWWLPVLFRSTKVPFCLDRGVAGTQDHQQTQLPERAQTGCRWGTQGDSFQVVEK
jgi:hypothetical protein